MVIIYHHPYLQNAPLAGEALMKDVMVIINISEGSCEVVKKGKD